jgi:hypothetical protein
MEWIHLICLRIGTRGGLSDETSGSIKGGEFIDKLSDCQFLKKHSVQRS